MCSEVVLAGQDGTIVHVNSHVSSRVNSQWLYLHACSLHMTKQAKNPSIDQGRAREVLSLAAELLAVGGFLGRERVSFL